MKPFFATWEELASLAGNALVIINSPDHDQDASGWAIDRVAALGAAVHVIAPGSWKAWLAARGLPDDQVLLSVDGAGANLELNYFLESPTAVAWIVPKHFAAVVGSAPHGRHNEEVKIQFEERVGMFLRDGLFLAHALPGAELYVFDLASLFERLGRGVKLAAYEARTRSLIASYYRLWCAEGRPARSDGIGFSSEIAILRGHLDETLSAFDEEHPFALHGLNAAGTAAAAMVNHLADVVIARDHALSARIREIAACHELIEATPYARVKRWLRRLVE